MQQEFASTVEADRTNSTLRLHFKALGIITVRSIFKEEINATHPRNLLRHGDCSPFALKCACCVESHLAVRLRFALHANPRCISTASCVYFFHRGLPFSHSSLKVRIQATARPHFDFQTHSKNGITFCTLVWRHELCRWAST